MKITEIEIIDDSYKHDTSRPDPDDEWDRASTHTDHNFTGFKISKKWGDVKVGYDVEPEKTYYLVVVVYSTGDSFGHDSGYGAEYIDLYQSKEDAEEVKAAIESNYNTHSDYSFDEGGNKLKIKNSIGKPFDLYTGAWKGYFESMDYVEVVPMELH